MPQSPSPAVLLFQRADNALNAQDFAVALQNTPHGYAYGNAVKIARRNARFQAAYTVPPFPILPTQKAKTMHTPTKLLALIIPLALAACAVNTDVPSRVAVPPSFEQTGEQTRAVSGQPENDLSRWWTTWQDPVLRDLVEQTLRENRNLAAAQANMQAAQAQADLADAARRPQIGTGANLYATGKQDNPLPNGVRQAAGSINPQLGQADFDNVNLRSAALSASWSPDIFGQKKSDAEAARQVALGEAERWHGAQLMLAAETAQHYLNARALEARQAQAAQREGSLKNLLRYVQARFKAGHVSAYEVRQVEAQLAAAQAEAATLDAQRTAHVRSIAVLTGQVPQGFRLPESSANVLTNLPAPPQGATPLDVLTRRPDVRAAERQARAAAAKLASAKMDRLPRFDIQFAWNNGRIGLDNNLSSIAKSTGGLLSAGVTVPLFTAGRIRANIAAADARVKAAAAQYDNTLLTALSEVDSSYHLQRGLFDQRARAADAAAQSNRQASQSRRLFELGKLTLDQALTAEINASQAQEALLRARLAEGENLLRLYQALGGGWQD